VIGGRLHKGETLEEAAIRKVREETGLQVKEMRPIGYFELVNGKNPFGLPSQYHAVSVVFATVIDDRQPINLDNQSKEFKFAKELPADFYIKSFYSNNCGELELQKSDNCREEKDKP
jgi:colanic acid biosynthesis protein WcaH